MYKLSTLFDTDTTQTCIQFFLVWYRFIPASFALWIGFLDFVSRSMSFESNRDRMIVDFPCILTVFIDFPHTLSGFRFSWTFKFIPFPYLLVNLPQTFVERWNFIIKKACL